MLTHYITYYCVCLLLFYTESREVILLLGGWEGKKPCCSIQTLDPFSDQWKTLGYLPFAVWSPGLVASGEKDLQINWS